jgi:transcriptional regulator NrdR family protein
MKLSCPSCQSNVRIRSTEQTPTEIYRWCTCTNCKFKFRTVERYYLVKPTIINKPKLTTQKLQGSNNHAAVFQEQDVIQLRTMAKTGTTSKELAKVFGITQGHVNRILRYEAWKHVS